VWELQLGEQDWEVFKVRSIVAVQGEAEEEIPQAAIKIPAEWLMALLDETMIRHAQRPDTTISLTTDGLTLSGVELLVERRWVREQFWHQISEAVTHGFIHKTSAVQVTLRGDRRERQRPVAGRPAR